MKSPGIYQHCHRIGRKTVTQSIPKSQLIDFSLKTLKMSVAAGVLIGSTLSAHAQTENVREKSGSLLLEEITVTAQKREQNLQDVPIAITSFTGDQMAKLGVTESFDIAEFSPGVHIGGSIAGQNTQFTIRGVTQNDFNDIVEAPNAVYVDEGYIAVAQGQTFAVLDIERVEILKGPQGTLFGRNATGGLVHYITRKPNFDEVEGYVNVNYGLLKQMPMQTKSVWKQRLGDLLGKKWLAVSLSNMSIRVVI